ncbi:cytochrome c biogenesis protein CcsA [bacterium]|nr:cytochrome c biogenesis protein CcsA [bacterium]
MTLPVGLSLLLCSLYAILVALYARYFWAREDSHRRVLTRVGIVTVMVLHLAYLVYLVGARGRDISVFASTLTALALSLTFTYFLIEWISRERDMGLWVLVLPLILQVIATFRLHASPGANSIPESPLLGLHVAMALIGYCAFCLSAVFSFMYLAQYRQIKGHRVGRIFERLPSLSKLENMGYRAVHFGLGFLVVAIILGEYMFYRIEGMFVWADPKIVVGAVACVIYGVAILLRRVLSLQGKRFAIVSILGFGLILFSLLVVDELLPGFHRY